MFKTMALIVAFLISLGIITSPEQVSNTIIQQYECEIIILEGNTM